MLSRPAEQSSDIRSHHTLLIIGAGFSGLGLGIRLRARGMENFLILEQAAGVGGTWWMNRYPGCACDVQSHLYSLSYAPKPDWSRRFAPREEIQAYLAECVERFGLEDHLRLNTRVGQARWDESCARWLITDQTGTTRSADILVSATGGLSRPAWPQLPGLTQFGGRIFHSQQWPDDVDLDGKRVAVIGCGASAVQFVPRIQPRVAQLDLYQRTPQWILPRPDRAFRPFIRTLLRHVPPARLGLRMGLYLQLEARLPAFTRWPVLSWFHRRQARRFLARQVADPELRARLTPRYMMGCKRVLLASDFYPALTRANVELITAGIRHVEPHAIVDQHERRRLIDTVILATGFQATQPVPPGLILGRDGLDLAEQWKDGPSAYKGTAVHGFPNLFVLLGPNTALGHNSVLLMIEAQIDYLLNALEWRQRNNQAVLEVSETSQRRWNERLDDRSRQTVWRTGGCASWYLHPASGRNTTLWPGFTWTFRRQCRRFDPLAYRTENRC